MIETAEFWKKHNYELVRTEDRSPTLRWLGSETQETMHHRGGAYSETQQIYGQPLRDCLKSGGSSALSVGLGLGYNEILVALEAFQAGLKPSQFKLLSYESDPFLKLHFLTWVLEGGENSDLVYDEIFQFFNSPHKAKVKFWLKEAYETGTWKLESALESDFQLRESYECLFYDAFSSKTSPHLWQEEFLVRFFEEACAPKAWVTTYACTGALKRALKENGFQLTIREGFQSKRNSTLGVRSPF